MNEERGLTGSTTHKLHMAEKIESRGCSAIESIFVWSACSVFMLTAFAKLVSAFQHQGYLDLPDVLFGFLSTRQVFLLGTLVELSAVFAIIWSSTTAARLAILAWVGTVFLVYRTGVAWVQTPRMPCPCLGNVGTWLHLNPQVVGLTAKILLAYLVFFSYGFLLFRKIRTWVSNGAAKPTVLDF